MTANRHRATAVVLAALLVAGAGAVAATAERGTDDALRVQETTTESDSSPLVVGNLSAPSEVETGTPYTVTAEIENRGTEEAVRDISYQIAGSVVNATSVRLAPNARETVTFDVTAEDTAGFPTGTFTQGVFTDGAEATANLTLTDGAAETDTPTGEATTPTETTETPEGAGAAQVTTTERTEAEVDDETTTAEETTAETTATETTTTETTTTETATETDEAQAAQVTTETTATETEAPEEETPAEDTATATETPTETTTQPQAADVTTPTTATPEEPTRTTAAPEETTTTATPTTEEATAERATLTFENQTSNGSAVTIQSVSVPEGGFVVVHDNGVVEGEVVDSILGTSDYLEAGTTQNVTVELDEPLDQSQRLVAVVYRDTNDDQTFDLVASNRTADGPYTKPDSREAVNGIAVVDVEDGSTNETET